MSFDFDLEPGKRYERQDGLINKHEPVISIITPFYSGHDYIEQTCNCVLNQTYPYFEWIIVSDGKTDDETKKLLNKIKNKDERIKIYYKENGGLAHTRDYGANKASKFTKYFVFLDDDDLIDKTYLECAYLTLETNKEASFAYTDIVGFGVSNYIWPKWFTMKEEVKTNILVATSMIRKEDFFELGGYGIKEKGVNEDWIFWLKLFSKNKIGVRMNYYGFWYRKKSNGELNVSRQRKNTKKTHQLIKKYVDIKKINKNLEMIQYPRDNYEWDSVVQSDFGNLALPKYKDNGKIKILMIIPWMMMGGADKFNVDLINGLDKNKYEVIIICTEPNLNNWRQKFENGAKEIYDLTTFLDRDHWHSFIKYIIESRNINIIFNTNSVAGYYMLPYLKSEYPNIPIMDYIHMEEWYNRNGGYSRDSSSVAVAIDRTLTCNKKSADILVDYFKRDRSEIDTVYIGVDEKKFDINNYNVEELRKKYAIDNDKFIINYVCRIANQKRPILFVEIMKHLKLKTNDFICLVAGDGPMLNMVKTLCKTYKLTDNVKFLGSVSNPSEIYAISDVSLNCSIKEGLALTSYESLSIGTPVVSADVGGQSELIDSSVGAIVKCMQKEEEIDCYNYSDEEIDSYVDELINIKNNKEKYKSNCRKRILNGFTIDQMIKNMSNEFDNLLKIKPKHINDNKRVYMELMNTGYLGYNSIYSYLCENYNCTIFESNNYKKGWTTSKVKLFMINLIKKIKVEAEVRAIIRIIKDIGSLFKIIGKKITRIFKK